MAKVVDKELVNLKLKLRLVREEIKNRERNATSNVKGLKRAQDTERKLLERIKVKESKDE